MSTWVSTRYLRCNSRDCSCHSFSVLISDNSVLTEELQGQSWIYFGHTSACQKILLFWPCQCILGTTADQCCHIVSSPQKTRIKLSSSYQCHSKPLENDQLGNSRVMLVLGYSAAKLCSFFWRSCSLHVWCSLICLVYLCCLCSWCLLWNAVLPTRRGHYCSKIRTDVQD